jgi:hypothetical protein
MCPLNVASTSAERTARAATDTGAREMLTRLTIKEEASADRVSVETQQPAGILIGASFEVRYRVRVPRGAAVRVRTANGAVALTGLSGHVEARSTNGGVTGRDLAGAVDLSTTNGALNADIAALAGAGVRLKTVNGGIQISLPASAAADVTATCTNGRIDVSDVPIDVRDQTRRSVEGRMNGGGAPVELHTTNGGIRIRSRAARGE